MALLPSASIINIDPNTLQPQTFSQVDGEIIPNFTVNSLFNPQTDNVEFFIYDADNNILTSDYNFTGWTINSDSSTTNPGELEVIVLDPLNDAINAGYDLGEINLVYNFVSNKLGSNNNNTYYISEVSADRTELRLKSNTVQTDLSASFAEFSSSILASNDYFDEFYLNFGNNDYLIGINALLESSSSILIKLYESLSPQFDVDSTLYIVTKPAESIAYNIQFNNTIDVIDTTIPLRGPNYNLEIKNLGGATTDYLTHNSILSSPITTSQYQLNSFLNTKGVEINADYTDFSTFIHFSSAQKRLNNFYYKIKSIEDYQRDLNSVSGITGGTQSTFAVSSSKAIIQSQIDNIITNFDSYEYYLYYESGSWAWPKSNLLYPYILESTGSANVISWYSNIQESASIFDDANQNNLIYTIPEFIREDSDNTNYESFIYMMGQFFDILWLYTKGLTDKLNADNRLLAGVSKDLVADVIKSLGVETYTDNYALQNIYTAFIGVDPSGSYLPPTGSELITNYIAVNSGSYPYGIDEVNKEIYKRLYHNISYILKKKGTTQAIRELANIYGIPPTILRISEFGGRDKLQDTGDYWQDIFNYAYTFDGTNNSTVTIPWKNLEVTKAVPETFMFRFKRKRLIADKADEALIFKGNIIGPSNDFTITLKGTGSLTSGSYSGSIIDPYYQYGSLDLKFQGLTTSASIYLPFFNDDWWTVAVTKPSSNNTATLYAQNKLYNGYDGNIIGFKASSSITSATVTTGWNNASSRNIYLGRANTIATTNVNFDSGSMQEFRYYGKIINPSIIDSYTLNPLSIESNQLADYGSLISQSSYINLSLRAPLGAVLDSSSILPRTSSHPAISGYGNTSLGFTISTFSDNTSDYTLGSAGTFEPNVETIFIKEPVAGIKNRVTNKIQLEQNIAPGNTLSSLISIQQNNLPQSGTYTSDVDYLEVVFSPQNEINDDISDQLGGFNIGEFISPDEIYGTSSLNYYPALRDLSEDYFKKYNTPYDVWDYIRLIKFFDNSFFKLVKDFVPARTTLASGVLIKQHLLERNRHALVDPDANTTITFVASASVDNIPYSLGNILLTASINSTPGLLDGQKIYNASDDYNSNPILIPVGGTAGVMPSASSIFGPFGSSSFAGLNLQITQSWSGFNNTKVGLVPFSQSTQDEFYNGEFSGSTLIITDQRLVDEDCVELLAYPSTDISYRVFGFFKHLISSNWGTMDDTSNDSFLNPNVVPLEGQMYAYNGNVRFQGTTRDGVSHIKINKTDLNGTNLTNSLLSLNSLRLVYSGSQYKEYTIDSRTNFPTYYLYTLRPIINYLPQIDSYSSDYSYVNRGDFEIQNGPPEVISGSATVIFTEIPSGNNFIYLIPVGKANGTPTTGSDVTYAINSGLTFKYTTNDSPWSASYNSNIKFTASAWTPSTEPTANILSMGLYSNLRGFIVGKRPSSPIPIASAPYNISLSSSTVFGSDDYILAQGSSSGIYFTNETIFLGIEFDTKLTSLNVSDVKWDFNPSPSNNPLLTILDPYITGNEPFEFSDCNVLYGNVDSYPFNPFYMDVDYSTNGMIAVNTNQIISGSATRSTVKPYYYSLDRHIIPRYEGSKNIDKGVREFDSVVSFDAFIPGLAQIITGSFSVENILRGDDLTIYQNNKLKGIATVLLTTPNAIYIGTSSYGNPGDELPNFKVIDLELGIPGVFSLTPNTYEDSNIFPIDTFNPNIFEYKYGSTTFPEIPNASMLVMGNILEVADQNNVNILQQDSLYYEAYNKIISDNFTPNTNISDIRQYGDGKQPTLNNLKVITSDFGTSVSPSNAGEITEYWVPTSNLPSQTFLDYATYSSGDNYIAFTSSSSAPPTPNNGVFGVELNELGQYITGSFFPPRIFIPLISQSLLEGNRWFITMYEKLPNPLDQTSLTPLTLNYNNEPLAARGIVEIVSASYTPGASNIGRLIIETSSIIPTNKFFGTLSNSGGLIIWKATVPSAQQGKYVIIDKPAGNNLGPGAIVPPDSNNAINQYFNKITTTYGANTKPPTN